MINSRTSVPELFGILVICLVLNFKIKSGTLSVNQLCSSSASVFKPSTLQLISSWTFSGSLHLWLPCSKFWVRSLFINKINIRLQRPVIAIIAFQAVKRDIIARVASTAAWQNTTTLIVYDATLWGLCETVLVM